MLLSASTVDAGHRNFQVHEYSKLARSNSRISLDQAVTMVQKRTGGRILSAGQTGEKDHVVYRIKVLTPSGHVRIYHVDANTGQIH